MITATIVIGLFILAFSCATYAIICVVELYKNITRSSRQLNFVPLLMLFRSTYDSSVHKYYYRFWIALFVALSSGVLYSYLISTV